MTAETDFQIRHSVGSIDSETAHIALRRIAIAALFAIALGFVMQGFILFAKLATGEGFPGMALYVDLAQGVTWSFLVCAGISVATAVTKGRVVLASFMAALFAPVALALAKSAQKAMGSVIGAASEPGLLSLTTIGIFRAVEYGLLGFVLALLVQRQESRAWPYLGTGAAVGLIIGGAFVGLNLTVAEDLGRVTEMPKLTALVVNEVFFPIGCALVIYASQWVGRSLKVVLQGSN